MSVVYSADSTAPASVVRYRATGPDGLGNFTFNQRRAFMPFDLLSTGLSAGDVESADLIFIVQTVTGGGCPARVTSSGNAGGFGATLDATNADWASSDDNLETEIAINATGTYTVPVAVANLDFSGETYYRLMNAEEGQGAMYDRGFTFSTGSAGTPSNRPILRLTLRTGQLIFVQMI